MHIGRAHVCAGVFLFALSTASVLADPSPTPPPRIVPRPMVEHYALIPTRPPDSSRLRIEVARVVNYSASTDAIASMILVLRGTRGVPRYYYLAENTTLNGKPLRCRSTISTPQFRLCGSMPEGLAVGKMVAVLYWTGAFADRPDDRSSDEIVTVDDPN